MMNKDSDCDMCSRYLFLRFLVGYEKIIEKEERCVTYDKGENFDCRRR